MSISGLEFEREEFSCRLCTDLLQDPVTIPCGHSFCRRCVQSHWDRETTQLRYTCPWCPKTFIARPALVKDATLTAFIEQFKAVHPKESSASSPGESPRHEFEREEFSCRLCTDLLQDPVTIPCGHSFCRRCVQSHWDRETTQLRYTCPWCPKTFIPRPALVKDATLTAFIEKFKAIFKSSASSPGGIPCDVCPGSKRRAAKSCLRCRESYCVNHLRPHYDVPQLKKHKLVEPRDNLDMDNICSVHYEVINMFCHNDNQSVCPLCAADQHKGCMFGQRNRRCAVFDHEVISTEAEVTRIQKELEERRQKIKMKIQQKEKQLKELRQTAAGLRSSAGKALQLNLDTFGKLCKTMTERESSVAQEIQSIHHATQTGMKVHTGHIKEDVVFLIQQVMRRKSLLQTQHAGYQFLLKTNALPDIPEETESRMVSIHYLSFLHAIDNDRHNTPMNLTSLSFTFLERKMGVKLREEKEKLTGTANCQRIDLTWDPKTAHNNVLLELDENGWQRAKFTTNVKGYPDHPDRFNDCVQVLCKEPLTGIHYFEVRASGGCFIGLTYKSIRRKGNGKQCILGLNDKSWSCFGGGFIPRCCGDFTPECLPLFQFGETWVLLPDRQPDRIAVFLDHDAGLLAFFVLNDGSLSFLHKIETTFTEPLYFGATFVYPGDYVVIPNEDDE